MWDAAKTLLPFDAYLIKKKNKVLKSVNYAFMLKS